MDEAMAAIRRHHPSPTGLYSAKGLPLARVLCLDWRRKLVAAVGACPVAGAVLAELPVAGPRGLRDAAGRPVTAEDVWRVCETWIDGGGELRTRE